MLILGLLGIAQMAFLPGFLVLRGCQAVDGFLRTLVRSFALSLVINYFFIAAATGLGIYTRPTLLALMAVELALLGWFIMPLLLQPIRVLFEGDWQRARVNLGALKTAGRRDAILGWVCLAVALCTLIGFGGLALRDCGQVFNRWDDVVSWNRWAVAWAGGRFPDQTYHYPQLLPANWSLTYVLMDHAGVQFFAKAVMQWFYLLILAGLLDLWLRTKAPGYLAALPITGLLLVMGNGVRGMMGGHADVPVAFLALVAVSELLLSGGGNRGRAVNQNLVIGTACCVGAALTKQAGLFLVLIYPWLAVRLVLRRNYPRLRERFRWLLAMGLLMAVLVAPWYAFAEMRIRRGRDISEITMVTRTIHRGRTLGERLVQAPELLREIADNCPPLDALVQRASFGRLRGRDLLPAVFIAILGLGLFSLGQPVWRCVLGGAAYPFFLIWSLYFSYDLRNLSLAIPWLGIGAGMGAVALYRGLARALVGKADVPGDEGKPVIEGGFGAPPDAGGERKSCPAHHRPAACPPMPKLAAVWVICGVAVVIANVVLPRDLLVRRQDRLQRRICWPEVDDMLYAYQRGHGFEGKVLTDYQPMRCLPEVGEYYQYLEAGTDLAAAAPGWPAAGARYILIKKLGSGSEKYLEQELASGHLERIPNTLGWTFLKIKAGTP